MHIARPDHVDLRAFLSSKAGNCIRAEACRHLISRWQQTCFTGTPVDSSGARQVAAHFVGDAYTWCSVTIKSSSLCASNIHSQKDQARHAHNARPCAIRSSRLVLGNSGIFLNLARAGSCQFVPQSRDGRNKTNVRRRWLSGRRHFGFRRLLRCTLMQYGAVLRF